MSSVFEVHVREGAQDVLAGFPFLSDLQYKEEVFDCDGNLRLYIVLLDADDLSAGQEQFLDTSPDVVEYKEVKDV